MGLRFRSFLALGFIVSGALLILLPVILSTDDLRVTGSQILHLSCNSTETIPIFAEKNQIISFYFVKGSNVDQQNVVNVYVKRPSGDNVLIQNKNEFQFYSDWKSSFVADDNGPYTFFIKELECHKNTENSISFAWFVDSQKLIGSSILQNVGGILAAFGLGLGFDVIKDYTNRITLKFSHHQKNKTASS